MPPVQIVNRPPFADRRASYLIGGDNATYSAGVTPPTEVPYLFGTTHGGALTPGDVVSTLPGWSGPGAGPGASLVRGRIGVGRVDDRCHGGRDDRSRFSHHRRTGQLLHFRIGQP